MGLAVQLPPSAKGSAASASTTELSEPAGPAEPAKPAPDVSRQTPAHTAATRHATPLKCGSGIVQPLAALSEQVPTGATTPAVAGLPATGWGLHAGNCTAVTGFEWTAAGLGPDNSEAAETEARNVDALVKSPYVNTGHHHSHHHQLKVVGAPKSAKKAQAQSGAVAVEAETFTSYDMTPWK
jgi:hypothetical protein